MNYVTVHDFPIVLFAISLVLSVQIGKKIVY